MPGSLFAIAGTKELKLRVYGFADGAGLGGWIGMLIGAIMILTNLDFNNWQENLPPASAIMLLTVFSLLWLLVVCSLFSALVWIGFNKSHQAGMKFKLS